MAPASHRPRGGARGRGASGKGGPGPSAHGPPFPGAPCGPWRLLAAKVPTTRAWPRGAIAPGRRPGPGDWPGKDKEGGAVATGPLTHLPRPVPRPWAAKVPGTRAWPRRAIARQGANKRPQRPQTRPQNVKRPTRPQRPTRSQNVKRSKGCIRHPKAPKAKQGPKNVNSPEGQRGHKRPNGHGREKAPRNVKRPQRPNGAPKGPKRTFLIGQFQKGRGPVEVNYPFPPYNQHHHHCYYTYYPIKGFYFTQQQQQQQ